MTARMQRNKKCCGKGVCATKNIGSGCDAVLMGKSHAQRHRFCCPSTPVEERGWFSLNVPAGLTLYWFINNILSTAQQVRHICRIHSRYRAVMGWSKGVLERRQVDDTLAFLLRLWVLRDTSRSTPLKHEHTVGLKALQ
eukprot:1142695-Pelagomonas_calceolata.AAC.4